MRVARTALVLTLSVALAACGSDGSSGSGDTSPTDPTPPTEATPGPTTAPPEPTPAPTPDLPEPNPDGPTAYLFDLPPGFPQPLIPEDNPMTVEGVELGRHLFFDRRLSLNEQQSCGDCHQQALGFADGLALAEGSTGDIHPRNAPGLTNVAYNPTLTWMNPLLVLLEEQALGPLFGEDPVELGFGGREEELIERLRSEALYQILFGNAYPDEGEPINLDNITKALSSFQRTMISGNSPFDKFVYQGDDDALSQDAKEGFLLFDSETLECNHCHGGLNFASSLTHEGNPNDPTPFENNGMYNIGEDGRYPWPNLGLYEFTENERDYGRMKPPTLRNIEVTGPYMHDGSLETLEDVMRHYERGGTLTPDGPNAGDGKQNPNKSGFLTGFPLTSTQRAQVIAFFESLTDHEFLSDPRFANPFPDE